MYTCDFFVIRANTAVVMDWWAHWNTKL